MDIIERLCNEYTDLIVDEIMEIREAAKALPAMASMFNADAFIDCPLNDGSGDSIVVVEAKPVDGESSYKKPVVGLVATKEKEPAVYRTFKLGVPTKFMKAVTQENAHVVQTVEPIYSKDRIIGVYIIEQRMEEVARATSEDEEFSSERLALKDINTLMLGEAGSAVADSIEEGLLLIDKENKVVFRNKSAEDIHRRLGFLTEILGQNYNEICLSELPSPESGNSMVKEIKLGDFYFLVKTLYIGQKDLNYIVTISDITSRKMQEQALVLRSVAFKEMHHRVKNNLQTMAALLRLQRNNVESQEAKIALSETMSRIYAISSTHQLLVEADIEDIKLNDMISSIKTNTVMYYDRPDFDLQIECFGGDFDIKYEQANALALVLNELLQNSIKHAFPKRDSGKIVIMAFQKGMDAREVVYMDDGCGFDVDNTKSEGIGSTIVDMMVKEKLKGHMSVRSNSSGSRFNIIF